jgi:hypothetical protein
MPGDCELVDAMLDQRAELLPEKLHRHIEGCARCRGLHEWLISDADLIDVSPTTVDRLSRLLKSSLRPVNPLPPTKVSVIQASLCFVMLTLGFTSLLGTAGLAQMGRLESSAMVLLFTTGLILFSVSLARQMRPGSGTYLSKSMVVLFVLGLLTCISLLFPWHASQSFVAQGWPCLFAGLVIGVLGAVVLWLVVRRGAPVLPGTMGANLGATAGLLGVSVLQFQCPYQQAPHLLVWHGTVLVAVTLACTGIMVIATRILGRRK